MATANGSSPKKAKEADLDAEDATSVKPAPLVCSMRLTLVLVAFFMFFHLYAQRVGMSVAIVSMVNRTAVRELQAAAAELESSQAANNMSLYNNMSDAQSKPASPGEQCSLNSGGNGTKKDRDGPFVWEKEIQGHVLGAFFYGYLVSQVPGGLLAERFGAKWIIAGFLGLSTFATLLTPIAARTSFILLIILRALCGIGSGALFPAMHAMLGQWAPPMERSKLCGLVMAGTMMGNVITMPVAGLLCEYGFSEGWDSVFYVIGLTSTVTIALWLLITSNTPAEHPRISKLERDYIMNSLKGGIVEHKPTLCEMPWLKIITSGPVWALIIANFCVDWGLYTYLTNIPTFFSEVLFFDIKSNGLFSALPFLGLWAACNICPLVADKLAASNVLSVANVRKLFNTIGMIGAAIMLIGLSFLDCTQTALAVSLLVIAVGLSGCVYSGYYVNHMDIAPQYAGTLMGIANGIAAASGFIAPYVASVITKSQTRESWQIVFFIAAGVYTFGAVMYCILGRGTLQSWARGDLSHDIYEIEPMQVHAISVNGVGDRDKPSSGPIYKPKNAANGDSVTDHMLETNKV